MQYHAIPCNTVQYHAIPCIPCKTMQYNAIPCNTMQYHASLITADGAHHCPVGSIMAIFNNGGVPISKKISICNSFDLSFPEKSKNLDDCDHLAEGRGAALFLKLVGNSSLPQFQLLHSCQLLDLPTH